MQIKRTANAGVLLSLDGVSLLLDGVSDPVSGYLATPEQIKPDLACADAYLYTHRHADHFNKDFAKKFESAGTAFGPGSDSEIKIKDVSITPVATRHIGAFRDRHCSYIIKGSKTVWFMGDASPSCLHLFKDSPDVIIAPFAYANTSSAFERTLAKNPKNIIILHLPDKESDEYSLWDAVASITANTDNVFIPDLLQTIEII